MNTLLNQDGQPVSRGINWHSNLTKSLESLLGICRGLLADNVLSEQEIVFLDTWLRENENIINDWPANVIAERIEEIMADGRITAEESEDLKETISQCIGSGPQENGVVAGMATQLPFDQDLPIAVPDRTFLFTGKFIYGPRSRCQKAVIERGGIVAKSVTKRLDYLVIGTLASRDWKYTSHGRKIEKAVEYRDGGCEIAIVAEQAWVQCIQ